MGFYVNQADKGANDPLAVDVILKGSYMDDISLEQLYYITTQINNMCLSACLPLDKWKSNHSKFSVPSFSSQEVSSVHSFKVLTLKILGISWHSHEDVFSFQSNIWLKPAISKRSILSEVAQLFGPLGFISPVVIKAQILMQQLWLEKIGCDDPTNYFRDNSSMVKISRWCKDFLNSKYQGGCI